MTLNIPQYLNLLQTFQYNTKTKLLHEAHTYLKTF